MDKVNRAVWSLSGKSISQINSDTQYNPGQTVKLTGTRNDAYTVTDNTQVRQIVYSTPDFDPLDINAQQAADQSQLEKTGYLSAASDFLNVEMTGYFFVISRTAGTPTARGGQHIRFIVRGGRQGANYSYGCEGASYHAVVMMDGSMKATLQKEIQYYSTEDYASKYNDDPTVTLHTDYYQKWIGIKFIVYNIPEEIFSSGKKKVKLELWIDQMHVNDQLNNDFGKPANRWKKVIDYVDAGQWCKGKEIATANMCGGSSCQKITWGSPLLIYRWDNLQTVWYKAFSVRKIVAGSRHPVALSTQKALQTTSKSTADTEDLEDGDASTWPVATMPEQIGRIEKQDYGLTESQTELAMITKNEIYPTKTPAATGGTTEAAKGNITAWYQSQSSELFNDNRFSINTAAETTTEISMQRISSDNLDVDNFESDNFVSTETTAAAFTQTAVSNNNWLVDNSAAENFVIASAPEISNIPAKVVDFAEIVSVTVKEQSDLQGMQNSDSGQKKNWYTTLQIPNGNVSVSPRLLYQSIVKIMTPSFAAAAAASASSGAAQRQRRIPTTNQYELERQGFMFDENDYTNVEITAYVNLVSVNQDVDGQVSLVCRGSDAAEGCEGTSYQIQFFFKSGRIRVVKELTKGKLYAVSQSFLDRIPDLRNRWTGLKAVVYNYKNLYDPADNTNQNVVVIEVYIDEADNGNWENVLSAVDDGRFHRGHLTKRKDNKKNDCGGAQGQQVSWGGPVCFIKLHNIRQWSFKKLSIREIEPPKYIPDFTETFKSLTPV